MTDERERTGAAGARPDGGDAEGLRDAAPGIARVALGAWLRTAEWTVDTSLRAMQAAVSPGARADFLEEAEAELRSTARRLLGLDEDDEARRPRAARHSRGPTLRDRGADLLARSADVDYEEEAHPAYGRILEQLAPDEGRILRFLSLEGPQPSVDVRSFKPFYLGSQLVAPGLSMIGAGAGCRYLDRVPAYLNNLHRLGLVWFSREALEDPLRYQVLEAQPEVTRALKSAERSRTQRRSIHLTPFGADFCRNCLPLETAELDALPGQGRAAGEPAAPEPEPSRPNAGP